MPEGRSPRGMTTVTVSPPDHQHREIIRFTVQRPLPGVVRSPRDGVSEIGVYARAMSGVRWLRCTLEPVILACKPHIQANSTCLEIFGLPWRYSI
jgi:hypothetical protein